MRTLIDIARNDLRLIFQDRSIWINLVIVPIALSFIVGLANSGIGGGDDAAANAPDAPSVFIDVIDQDQSALSAQFIEELAASNPAYAVDSTSYTPEQAQTRLEDEATTALIVIPAGFEQAVNAGEGATLTYRSRESLTAPQAVLQSAQAVAARIGGSVSAAQFGMTIADNLSILQFADDADRDTFAADIRANAAELWAQNPVSTTYVTASASPEDAERAEAAGESGFTQSIPGMASMYVMANVLPAAAAFILERQNWTMQRLAAMPVRRWQILGGKLLARFLLGMIQYAIVFGFGLLIGVRYGDNPLALLLVMVAFVACVTALTLALTTVLKSPAQAAGIALFLSLTLAPLGGAWWPLDIVPAWMRTIGYLSPVAWAMDGYTDLIVRGGGIVDVLIPVGVLLAATAALFAYGVGRFKYTN